MCVCGEWLGGLVGGRGGGNLCVCLGMGTVLPNGVKVAVSDQSQKCRKLTKVGLACSLQLY